MSRMHNPVHPGQIVAQICDDLKASNSLSRNAIAKHLQITGGMLSNIIHGKASVTAAMALKLSEAFGMEPESWLAMQEQYDLWQAKKQKKRKKIALLIEARV